MDCNETTSCDYCAHVYGLKFLHKKNLRNLKILNGYYCFNYAENISPDDNIQFPSGLFGNDNVENIDDEEDTGNKEL